MRASNSARWLECDGSRSRRLLNDRNHARVKKGLSKLLQWRLALPYPHAPHRKKEESMDRYVILQAESLCFIIVSLAELWLLTHILRLTVSVGNKLTVPVIKKDYLRNPDLGPFLFYV